MSNKFYIDRKNMTADISNVPEETTKKQSTTKKKTTTKSTTKKKTTTKKDESTKIINNKNNKKSESSKSNEKSNVKYFYEHTTKAGSYKESKIKTPDCYGSNNNDSVSINKENPDDNIAVGKVSKENNSDDNMKLKKTIITIVALLMIITAVSLPVVKSTKANKEESKDVSKEE